MAAPTSSAPPSNMDIGLTKVLMPDVSKWSLTDKWRDDKPKGLFHFPAVLTTNDTEKATTILDKLDWVPRFLRAGPNARKNGRHMLALQIESLKSMVPDSQKRMLTELSSPLYEILCQMVRSAQRDMPDDKYVQAFWPESLALMRYLWGWDLKPHFDSMVEDEAAGTVFMACFGKSGLERTFRFIDPFSVTKYDLVTRPGDVVIFHSDCYRIMHGSLPLKNEGPFYSVTMRRHDGCGYLMGGKRGSSAVAAADAANKRMKCPPPEPESLVDTSDSTFENSASAARA